MRSQSDPPAPRQPLRAALGWAPVVFWCAMIFWGSTDTLSASHTSRFLTPFLHWLVPSMTDEQVGMVRMVIRKGGHVTEYLVLAVLVWRALRRGKGGAGWSWSTAVWAWAGATLYAVSDEVHQSFYPSRQASALDVGIDSCGAMLGLLACYWAGRWWRARGRGRRREEARG